MEQEGLRAILPEEFTSLRPVLRIHGEIRDGAGSYLSSIPVWKGRASGMADIGS